MTTSTSAPWAAAPFSSFTHNNLYDGKGTPFNPPKRKGYAKEEEEEEVVVPAINICPRSAASYEAAAADGFTVGDRDDDFGFDDAHFVDGPRSFWRHLMRERPLRLDGQGGLGEFFVMGSPTFVRTAQPALVGLATVGGLAVLCAVLCV